MGRWNGGRHARGIDPERPGQTGPGWPAGTRPGECYGVKPRPPLGSPGPAPRRTRKPKH